MNRHIVIQTVSKGYRLRYRAKLEGAKYKRYE